MKKRLLSLIICFVFVLPCAFFLTACGKAKPKSMSVTGAQTAFLYQDEFSFGEEASVEVKMSKGDNLYFNADNLVYDAETKTAETDNYKVDYSNFNANVLGEYDIKVTYKADTNITYSYKVTVSARPFADEDVVATDYSGVYDGAAHSISVECAFEGSIITYSTDGVEYAATNPTFKDVGEYTVYFIVDKENYAPPVSGTKTVTISKKEVTLNWGTTAFTYNKQEQVPTCSLSGVVQGDVCTITVTGEATNAGSYTATATNISNSNYKLPEVATKGFVINPKPVAKPTLTTAEVFTYNTAEQGLVFDADFEEGVGALGVSKATVAGRYTYTVGLNNANYVWNDGTTAAMVIDWEIKKKDVAVPTLVGEFTYNRLPQAPSIVGFDEDIMTKEGVEKNTNAGSFTIKFALKDNANYYWAEDNIAIVSGEKSKIWTIAKAVVSAESMRWNYSTPFSYDGTEKEVSLIGVPSGFEPLYEGNKKTNAGNYEATVIFIYDAQNYETIEIEPLYWSIAKILPTYIVPTGVEAEKADGLTLAGVSLAGFVGFEWLDPTTAVNASGTYTARYTPTDTTNYEVVNVQVYINLIDTSKGTLTSYVFEGSADKTKDIVIVVTDGTWDNGVTEFGVIARVEADFTTGNAVGATITYNDQESFAITKPGEYNVKIKVTKEGYNDFIYHQTIVVEKAELVVEEEPSLTSKETTTIDDRIDIVDINYGIVTYNGSAVSGTWAWKEPNTKMLLGDNGYVAVFTPDERDYYNSVEVELTVHASLGLPIRTFKVGDVTYTVSKDNSFFEVEVQLPYGQSAEVDFSSIKDGFSVYKYVYIDGYTSYLEPLTGTTFEIVSEDISFMSSVDFTFSDDGETISQTILLRIVEEYYLDEFKVSYTEGTDEIHDLDLMTNITGEVTGEIVHIFVEPAVDYLATTYVNGILLGTNITDVEVKQGENKILVVVKDAEGNAVRYIEKVFTYRLPAYYGVSNIAAISGQASKEMYVVNANGIMGIMFSTELDTEVYSVSLYKMNNANGSFTQVNFNKNLTLNVGANIYKAILSIPKAAKVVREFIIYDTSADGGFSYDEGSFDEHPYNIEIEGAIIPLINSNIEIGIIKPISLTDIVVKNPLEETAIVTSLINDYLLIEITQDDTKFFKVVKLNKYYIEDGLTDVKVFLITENGENVEEITDLTETIELEIMFDEIYIKTINPAASVSVADDSVMYDYSRIYTINSFDAKDIKVAITPANGTTVTEITLNVKANPVKVFGLTPIKTVGAEEVRGTEQVATMKGVYLIDGMYPYYVFGGDIKIDLANAQTFVPATAVDLVSNYTIYNETGEVWADGDGSKYIKIDIFASNCMIAKGFDFDEMQPTDVVDSTEAVMLEINQTAEGQLVQMYIIADDFGLIVANILLVEALEETKISLSVKDEEGEEVQNFDIDMKVIDKSMVLGGYIQQMDSFEYCVGSFAGSSEIYYVDGYSYEIYSYNNGVIGTTVLGVLNDYDGYVLESKTEGELEGIEIGTEFVFQGEETTSLAFVLEPNDELYAMIATLEGENLTFTVEVTEGIEVFNMENAMVKPEYVEVTGEIETFDNMGLPCFGLKLVYNSGKANEFEIIIQATFAKLEDIMGM